MNITLDDVELRSLYLQDPATRNEGGFQGLMVGLQDVCNRETGELRLSEDDLRRIPKYAFDYKNGGWENRLKTIFARHLGPTLGR